MNKSVVSRVLKRFRANGEVSGKKKSKRPRKTRAKEGKSIHCKGKKVNGKNIFTFPLFIHFFMKISGLVKYFSPIFPQGLDNTLCLACAATCDGCSTMAMSHISTLFTTH